MDAHQVKDKKMFRTVLRPPLLYGPVLDSQEGSGTEDPDSGNVLARVYEWEL